MEIKAGLTQALSPFPVLRSSEKGGGVGVGREKICLLHRRALALQFPQLSHFLVASSGSTGLTDGGITLRPLQRTENVFVIAMQHCQTLLQVPVSKTPSCGSALLPASTAKQTLLDRHPPPLLPIRQLFI